MAKIKKHNIDQAECESRVRAYRLCRGDEIYFTGNRDVKVGKQFENYPAVVSRVDYEHRKWWQFWKKKKMIGCVVLWIG